MHQHLKFLVAACIFLASCWSENAYMTPAAQAAEMVPATLSGHTGFVRALAYSPGGRSLASGSWDSTIKIWEADSGRCLATFPTSTYNQINALAYSPDGQRLASHNFGDIEIWEPISERCLSTLTGPKASATALSYSPDGRSLASAHLDTSIEIWDLASGRCRATLSGHTDLVNALAFSPDGRSLASASNDETAKIWDPASGLCLATLSGHKCAVKGLAYSPDGHNLASGGYSIRVWEPASGRCLAKLPGHTNYIGALAYSPDGRSLASGSRDNTIKIWEAASGRELRTIKGHTAEVNALCWSPDGRSLASGSSDNTIKIWPLAQDDVLCQYVPMTREERIKLDAQKMAADLLAKDKAAAAAKAAEEERRADEAAVKRMAQQLVAEKTKQQGAMEGAVLVGTSTTLLPGAVSSSKQSLDNSSTDRPIRDKWAVVVGVSKFQDPTIPKLQYPAKDARDFYNFLITKANFRPDHVRLLLDEKATKKRINSEIGDKFLPFVVGPDDLVVVYFATHGSPAEKDVRGDSYLIAYDTEKTELWSDGIDMPKLLGTLQERTRADRILIVLDACHSGAADPNSRALDFQSTIDIEKFSVGRGNIILSSSEPNELSWESKRYPNGIFTRRLIDCLSANPSIIKSFANLKNSVAEDARHEFGKFQTPRIKADGWEGKDLLINAPCTGSKPLDPTVKAKLQPDSTVTRAQQNR